MEPAADLLLWTAHLFVRILWSLVTGVAMAYSAVAQFFTLDSETVEFAVRWFFCVTFGLLAVQKLVFAHRWLNNRRLREPNFLHVDLGRPRPGWVDPPPTKPNHHAFCSLPLPNDEDIRSLLNGLECLTLGTFRALAPIVDTEMTEADSLDCLTDDTPIMDSEMTEGPKHPVEKWRDIGRAMHTLPVLPIHRVPDYHAESINGLVGIMGRLTI